MVQGYGGGYGKVGGNRRRGGSGAWQWMLIGFFPGVLCGGILLFGLVLAGLFEGFSLSQATPIVPPTQAVIVVTATQDPGQPSATPVVITTTPQPTQQAQAPQMALPTATEAQNMMRQQLIASQTAQAAGVNTSGTSDLSENIAPDVPQPTTQVQVNTTGTTTTTANTNANTNPGTDSGNPAYQNFANLATDLVPIPGGVFTMGTDALEVFEAAEACVSRDGGTCDPSYGQDSTPPFQAQIDPFQMERTEVTFQQYVAFLNYLRSTGQTHLNGCDGNICIQTVNEINDLGAITFDSANYNINAALNQYPVYAVTWFGAKAYCDALGRRLPTEAEWEFAAKGQTNRIYPWGDEWSVQLAKTNRPEGQSPGPVPVASYPNGSPFGILDMAGNVAEWTSDWYDEFTYQRLSNQTQPVSNPSGPTIALEKTVRGGSWDAVPFFARTVHRQHWFPLPDSNTDPFPRWVGFRCAADLDSNAAVAPAIVDPATLGTNTQNVTPNVPGVPTIPAAETGSETETQPGDGSRG